MPAQGDLSVVTLALTGGGAKCAAQAGALAVLASAGMEVRALAGVSGGGFVAVLYALGWSPTAIRDFIAAIHLLDLWDIDPARRALLGFAKLRALVDSAVGEHTFRDLHCPVILIAVDVVTGQEVHLDTGRLDNALLATMAMPGVLPPFCYDGHRLVDGAVTNPLPVGLARQWGHPVVAVDVGSAVYAPPGPLLETHGLLRMVADVGQRVGFIGLIADVNQAVAITTSRMRDYSLLTYPPAVLIGRPFDLGMFAFELAGLAYAAGQAAAHAALQPADA